MDMLGEYGIGCRTCGAAETCKSISLAAAWYLLHTVREHWDLIQQLHDADDQTVAAAIGLGTLRGWHQDIRP